MKKYLVLLLALVAVLPTALAKGPANKVTISGGALTEELVITEDETALQALSFMTLEDYETLTDDAPEGISGEGYLITRYYEDSRSPGRFTPFDEVNYYADPNGEFLGHIHYLGIVNGGSEYDGRWFRASRSGQMTLNEVLGLAAVAPETDASVTLEADASNVFELFTFAIERFLLAQ